MIRIIEVIPRSRLCKDLDIAASLANYTKQICCLLEASWINGEGWSLVEADEVEVRVRLGQNGECWQCAVYIDGPEGERLALDNDAAVGEYRFAAAAVWAWGKWAVMKDPEVEA